MADVDSRQEEIPQEIQTLMVVMFESVHECITETLGHFSDEYPELSKGEIARAACQALVAVVAAIITKGARTERGACEMSGDVEEFLHNAVHTGMESLQKHRQAPPDTCERVH